MWDEGPTGSRSQSGERNQFVRGRPWNCKKSRVFRVVRHRQHSSQPCSKQIRRGTLQTPAGNCVLKSAPVIFCIAIWLHPPMLEAGGKQETRVGGTRERDVRDRVEPRSWQISTIGIIVFRPNFIPVDRHHCAPRASQSRRTSCQRPSPIHARWGANDIS